MSEDMHNEDDSLFERWLRSVLNGDSIRDFFTHHLKAFMYVLFMVFVCIGNRYACEDVMDRVAKTQKQIKEVKYEILCVATELVELSRQSNLCKTLQEKDINLDISTTPPVVIESD